MSTDTAIEVENLAKSYLIGHQVAHGGESFREMVTRSARGVGRTALNVLRGRQLVAGDEVEEFWALQDVSFEVPRGEVMGVIGRNGAGKSTLLKILSRITEPTRGRAVIRGRVASLLEVGTGFHQELTGRENIYLNGAILGMSRAEIDSKFDEIVDFAQVERFLDTPVKRYSSGMYVRLAFAVAAHLEPEILIIDEVLAVGDVAFQKKCLGKMQAIAGAGRTVLFVSHNLPAVVELTTRALLIERGRLKASGPSRDVVAQFMRSMQAPGGGVGQLDSFRRDHRKAGYVDVADVRVCGAPAGAGALEFGDDLVIEVDLDVLQPVEHGIVNINIYNDQLEAITTLAAQDANFTYALAPGRHTLVCNAGAVPLMPGDYWLTVGAAERGGLAWDVLETFPGFRVDGHDHQGWVGWPDRPGVILHESLRLAHVDRGSSQISTSEGHRMSLLDRVKAGVFKTAWSMGYEIRRRDAVVEENPFDLQTHPDYADVIRAVSEFTMTRPTKIAALVDAVRYVSSAKIPGAIVECGVWRGGSMMAAARLLLERGDFRDLYLFDTYAGMTEPSAEDVDVHGGAAVDEFKASQNGDHNAWCYASLEDVQQNLYATGYPRERLHFVKGDVMETLPHAGLGDIALLRLDTDWYESTMHELRELYPKLNTGGVLIIDDYDYWKGCKQAVDEYFGAAAPLLMRIEPIGKIAVKTAPLVRAE